MEQTGSPAKVASTAGLGPLVERLRACSIDPMWADHAEVPKNLCAAAADMLEADRELLKRALEALVWETGSDGIMAVRTDKVIKALRAHVLRA